MLARLICNYYNNKYYQVDSFSRFKGFKGTNYQDLARDLELQVQFRYISSTILNSESMECNERMEEVLKNSKKKGVSYN